jgi:hypothetical protein
LQWESALSSDKLKALKMSMEFVAYCNGFVIGTVVSWALSGGFEVGHTIGIGCILTAWITMSTADVFLNHIKNIQAAVSGLCIAVFIVGIFLIIRY